MDFFTALSTEDMDTGVNTPLDVTAVIDADTASAEALDMVVDINKDINLMNQGTLATEHLEVQARNAEAILANPQGVNANVVALSIESFAQTAATLGFSPERADVPVLATEAIDNNPVSAMTLSQEGIKEFFKKIIDGIKKIFKKIGVSIKKLVTKLVVMTTGTEKAAIALKKKLKESKASGGEDISESDKTKIAKLSAGSHAVVQATSYSNSALTETLDYATTTVSMSTFLENVVKKMHTTDTFNGTDAGALSKTRVIEAINTVKAASIGDIDENLKDLGLDTDNSTSDFIFIPLRADNTTISGIKVELEPEKTKGDDSVTVKFTGFKSKMTPTYIDKISDGVKQLSSKEVSDLCDAAKTGAGASPKMLNKAISFMDNFDKELDKVSKSVLDNDKITDKDYKTRTELTKTTLAGLKLGGTSAILDTILGQVALCKCTLAVAKIQAKKHL